MTMIPAIDLQRGQVVNQLNAAMNVYNENPVIMGKNLARNGELSIHITDLEGTAEGYTPNFPVALAMKENSNLFCQIAGNIGSMETVDRYIKAGMDRIILDDSALDDLSLLEDAVGKYGERIALGVNSVDSIADRKGELEAIGLANVIIYNDETGDYANVVECKELDALMA